MGILTTQLNLTSITLSSDNRLTENESSAHLNWDVSWSGKNPNVLCISTTLGSSLMEFRQFPRFIINNIEMVQAPDHFFETVQIKKLYANFAQLFFKPWKDIHCNVELHNPNAQTLICRFSFTNQTENQNLITVEWFTKFRSNTHQRVLPWKNAKSACLSLAAEPNYVLTSIIGPTKNGQESIPSLMQTMQLDPQETKEIFVITRVDKSFESCQQAFTDINLRNWDALLARIELKQQSSMVNIQTHNLDWDAALYYAQIQAQRYLFSSSQVNNLKQINAQSVIDPLSQINDNQNLSNPLGKTLFNIRHEQNIIGLLSADQVQIALDDFFEHQEETGQLSWSNPAPYKVLDAIAFPCAATIAWQVYSQTNDLDWLTTIYPKIKKFLQAWFYEQNDKDQDNCPEWSNPYQAGLEEALLYKQYPFLLHPYLYNLYENPGLLYFLIQEQQHAALIANQIGLQDDKKEWGLKSGELLLQLKSFWDKKNQTYQPLEYLTHLNKKSKMLKQGKGDQRIHFTTPLPAPARILVGITLQDGFTRPIRVKISGQNDGKPLSETLTYTKLIWQNDQALFISKHPYTEIDQIQLIGLKSDETWHIQTLHNPYRDISMLLPLLQNKQQMKKVQNALDHPTLAKLLHPYGLPTIFGSFEQTQRHCISSIPWNSLMIEKMIEYGELNSAVELFEKIMTVTIKQLKNNSAVFSYYDCQNGIGFGKKNTLQGLLPVSLLMQLLGIQKISAVEINITHFNPFPDTFTVQYKGIKLILRTTSVEVLYRGMITSITKPGIHRICFSTNVVK